MVDTSEIARWLIDGARSAATPQDVLTQLCTRLRAAGVPLDRARVFVRTLHPNVMGRRFTWTPERGVEVMEAARDVLETESFKRSPVVAVARSGEAMRRRLCDPDCQMDSPTLDELRGEGFTDFLCSPLAFGSGDTHAVTWTTRHPGGFDAAALAGIEAVVAPLTRIAEIWALRRVATNLLDTYVGHQAGARILAGRILRGDIEDIEAVIWLSDLRGFTPLADRLPPAEVIARLNAFFECQIPVIAAKGGEVLKFMGDGLLAIFPVPGKEVVATCRAAVAAAREAETAIAALDPRPGFGLALHVGHVSYGNVGGGNRLDFTCIGPAVNLAARLEKLTVELQRTIVASAAFAAHVPEAFASLGAFDLKGFDTRQSVFAPSS